MVEAEAEGEAPERRVRRAGERDERAFERPNQEGAILEHEAELVEDRALGARGERCGDDRVERSGHGAACRLDHDVSEIIEDDGGVDVGVFGEHALEGLREHDASVTGYGPPREPLAPGGAPPLFGSSRYATPFMVTAMRLASLVGPELKELLREDPESVRDLLDEIHPEDVADFLSELEPEEAALLMRELPAEEAAPIFERLGEVEQEEIAEQLGAEKVAELASEMEADDRVDFIEALSDELGEQVLETLSRVDPEAAEEVREIQKYPEKSAGHLMTTGYVSVGERATVADAVAAIRAHTASAHETVYTVYVLDESEKLVGAVSVTDLLLAERSTTVAAIATPPVRLVRPDDDQEEVAKVMAKYDLNVVPVIGNENEFLGIITIDDIVDVLTEEQNEDVQRLGAVEPLDLPYFDTTFVEFIRKRGFWLAALFIGEFFTQTALRHYEQITEAVRGMLYYVPLLISAGGNSGSQSSTLVIRGLAVGEIRLTDWWRVLAREALMGLVLGSGIGLLAVGRVLMYPDQDLRFAITVGISVVGIVMTGCTVGAMLPMIMRRIGADPATSSTPFIASLVDVLGIIVFVQVARVVMAQALAAAGVH